jgi:hypothetical protein
MSLETESVGKNEKISESMKGNQNAKKGKLFADRIRMDLMADPQKLSNIVGKLIKQAEDGEPWAIKEIMDRMDGKAIQQTELSGPDGAELVKGIAITFVEPNAKGQ